MGHCGRALVGRYSMVGAAWRLQVLLPAHSNDIVRIKAGVVAAARLKLGSAHVGRKFLGEIVVFVYRVRPVAILAVLFLLQSAVH